MPFLIDGHNLLFAVRKSSEEFEAVNEIDLCYILSRFIAYKRSKGEIVYDGCGPVDKQHFNSFRNVKVRFSGTDTDADTIIEELLYENTHPKRLTVVSTDRQIRAAAKRRKALSVRSEEFWQLVVDTMHSKPNPVNEPKAKESGISKAEADFWLKLFKLE